MLMFDFPYYERLTTVYSNLKPSVSMRLYNINNSTNFIELNTIILYRRFYSFKQQRELRTAQNDRLYLIKSTIFLVQQTLFCF